MHRFRFSDVMDPERHPSYELLYKMVLTMAFPTQAISGAAGIKLLYQDLDMDSIIISCTRELMDAIAQFEDQGSLKLVATVADPRDSPTLFGAPLSIISDKNAASKMGAFLDEPPPSADNLVEYNGSLVSKDTATVLRHIVDEFKDHVTADFSPFQQTRICDHASIVASYQIEGDLLRSGFFAIDGIYLNLAQDVDESTVAIYMPKDIHSKFTDQLPNVQFQYHGPKSGTHLDLQKVHAKIDQVTPPIFYSVSRDTAGRIVSTPNGSIKDLMKRPEQRHLYKITGFFKGKVRLRSCSRFVVELTLVGLRSFAVHDILIKGEQLKCI